ncbi:hypothetical protein [Halomarina oriensis]|uniref:Uncharacterized protein n=1 Tax=Halomarina oriensis TaxID=671145 RepID=A0A6B0GL59_9EURY|nr:hypothetical protein [Halomarina oriensis]MWG34621.1 hypothetical protein [Halomarina oriensis]
MSDHTDGDGDEDELVRGRQYRYEDGVAEAVITTEEGRVLAVREYPSEERFREEVSAAVTTEFNDVLADIDAEAIMGEVREDARTDPAGDPSAGTGAAATGTENVAPAGTEDPDEDDEE